MERTVLVLGGRSEIGVAVAERLAGRDADTVVLAARRAHDLDAETARVRAAGAVAETAEFDADDLAGHRPLLDEVLARHGRIDVAVVAFGILGDQARAETDAAHAAAIVHTDYLAQVHLLTELAQVLRAQGSGTLVVYSSVAGVRVRRANYVYGSAKAGLDGFASGLADALHGSGVRLVLIRPGFVIGRMTTGMSPAPLSSTSDQVADATVRAVRRGRGNADVWVPGALRLLFTALRLLPRPLWRRMPR
ncbi:SDR family NAD(P)-dependent oxidoreductase [Pseudonocardia parietis]|uniref:NAD(P)-dependent dehydrogenase (Short-subunit alcohol dehydrogenase family) n=1 Tax=Pseudonocardia parietis TaxID=570936 RepID=A0ABS4VXX7_9PSEU|nr:SDR family NAD(P)-dependent oxidoreductase [Pseudonocardia parietis]MBP2368795.1 NAD(P)-dependent dehydrogenase (short-subunit alcohol dehydrogenase family) [Pseudonocardia parietis]